MAYTLLQAVNKVLGRVGVIQGVSGNLTSLTDSGRQLDVDVAVEVWNEALQDIAAENDLVPGLSDMGTVTLANGTKEYARPSNGTTSKQIELVKWLTYPGRRFPLEEYAGGYAKMVYEQPDPTLFQGLPQSWVISPVSGFIRFDFTPTANEAGVVANVFGVPRIALTLAGDTFPVSDTVVEQLIKPVAMAWRRERQKGDFDRESYFAGLASAMRWAVAVTPRAKWGVGNRSWR